MEKHLLDTESPEPLYLQLADVLAQKISSGELASGDKLLSIRQLTEIYSVSNITVRKALELIRQRDLVFSVSAKGYFVSNRLIKKVMPASDGFTAVAENHGMVPSSIVHRAEIIKAGDDFGREFGISSNDEVVSLERVRLGNGIPLCFQKIYLPHYICPGILAFDFSESSLYRILCEKYNVHMGKGRHTIQAAIAEEHEILHLNLKPPAAILRAQHWSYTSSGQLFEDGKTSYRADFYQITSTMHEYELRPEVTS